MTEPQIPVRDFPLELGGKMYTLSFPISAVFKFEDLTGVSLTSAGERDPNELFDDLNGRTPRERLNRVIDLLFVGLSKHHPDLTRAQVADMVFIDDMKRLQEAAWGAFNSTMPQAKPASEAGDQDPTPAPAAPN